MTTKRLIEYLPVHHYAGPASDLSFTQTSDLRIIPDRNHPPKTDGPWFHRERFVMILAEYGIEDPLCQFRLTDPRARPSIIIDKDDPDGR